MNNNRLVIAIVVLAVLAGALASQLRSHEASTSVEKPKVSLPEIKRDDVTKVEIDNPEKKLKAVLVKQDKQWRLSAPRSGARATPRWSGGSFVRVRSQS